MRKFCLILIPLLLLTLALGAIGCGEEGEEPTPESTPTAAATATQTPEATATPTPAATSTVTPTPQVTIPPLSNVPCRFHGEVSLDGAPVADDIEITATIEGDTYTTATPSLYGPSTYFLQITPPVGKSYDDGTEITFKISTRNAAQTGSWETGGNVELDLSAG